MQRRHRRLLVSGLIGLGAVGLAGAVVVMSGSAPQPTTGDVLPGTAVGADVSGLRVAPLRVSVDPQQAPARTTFVVTNTGSGVVQVTPRTVELDDRGTALPDSTASAAGWASVRPSTSRLTAGASAEFAVTVAPPASREPGERRIGILFEPRTDDGAGGVGLVAAVGTSVFVPGSGQVHRGIELGPIASPVVAWSDAVALSVPVRNTGNVHRDFQTTGAEVAGTSSGGGAFAFTQGVVLPGEVADLHATWTPPTLCWCEVAVAMPDGTGQMVTSRTRVLVVRPWLPLALLGVLALLTTGLLVQARRRSRDRQPL